MDALQIFSVDGAEVFAKRCLNGSCIDQLGDFVEQPALCFYVRSLVAQPR